MTRLKALLAQGVDHFHTCDCEFNVPGDHAKAVCREIIDAGIAESDPLVCLLLDHAI